MRNQGNSKSSNPFAILKKTQNNQSQTNSREKELLEREIRLNRVYVVQDIEKPNAGRRNKKNALMPAEEATQPPEEDPSFQTVKKKVFVKKVIEKNQGLMTSLATLESPLIRRILSCLTVTDFVNATEVCWHWNQGQHDAAVWWGVLQLTYPVIVGNFNRLMKSLDLYRAEAQEPCTLGGLCDFRCPRQHTSEICPSFPFCLNARMPKCAQNLRHPTGRFDAAGVCVSKSKCENLFCDKIHGNIQVCVDFNHCEKRDACPDRHPMRIEEDLKTLRKVVKSHYTKKLLENRESNLKAQFSRTGKQRSNKRYMQMQMELGLQPDADEDAGMDCVCCRFGGIVSYNLNKSSLY